MILRSIDAEEILIAYGKPVLQEVAAWLRENNIDPNTVSHIEELPGGHTSLSREVLDEEGFINPERELIAIIEEEFPWEIFRTEVANANND